MSDESVEAQITELVAQTTGVAPHRVTLTSRLADDLGIDGADAIELFASVHQGFGTDLTDLYAEWSKHFAPDGMPLSTGLVVIPAAVAFGVAFATLRDFVGDVVAGALGAVIAGAAIAVIIWIGRKPAEDVEPITVGEVVRAVQAGAWRRSSR